jgi:hypothetical protein
MVSVQFLPVGPKPKHYFLHRVFRLFAVSQKELSQPEKPVFGGKYFIFERLQIHFKGRDDQAKESLQAKEKFFKWAYKRDQQNARLTFVSDRLNK